MQRKRPAEAGLFFAVDANRLMVGVAGMILPLATLSSLLAFEEPFE
jgi:hypothetical protein